MKCPASRFAKPMVDSDHRLFSFTSSATKGLSNKRLRFQRDLMLFFPGDEIIILFPNLPWEIVKYTFGICYFKGINHIGPPLQRPWSYIHACKLNFLGNFLITQILNTIFMCLARVNKPPQHQDALVS